MNYIKSRNISIKVLNNYIGGTKIEHIIETIDSLNINLIDNAPKYLEELYMYKFVSRVIS